MKKALLSVAGAAVLGAALPATPASAVTVVVVAGSVVHAEVGPGSQLEICIDILSICVLGGE